MWQERERRAVSTSEGASSVLPTRLSPSCQLLSMSITVLTSLPQLVGLTTDAQQISVIDFHAV